MIPTLYKWIPIIGCAVVFILSDTFSANWGRTASLPSLIAMIILAPIGYFIFAQVNRNSNFAVSSGVVNMMLIIGTTIISIFYFQDSLTVRQGFGLMFAIIAVICMV